MAGYLREGIAAAAADGAAAVVVQLNTPGGSLTATNEIKQAFLEAPLPVIVWVAPSGARAASAGTFITLAAHLAYMAPATNIGAASPVSGSGGDIPGTMGEKVRNDAIATIRAIAEAQGRPVDWAVSTVEDARSYSAREALEAGAVDGIAATIEEVLADADGRQVEVFGTGTVTLDVDGAAVTDVPMNPVLSFLHLLSDPNIAFILLVAGALLLATELVSPNLVTGILGALALVLAFIGFGSLPLNVVGVLLMAFGFVLFVLESQIVSHGLLTVAGLVCVVLGASVLYTGPVSPSDPVVQVAPVVLVATAGTLGAPHGPDHHRRHPDPAHEGPCRPARRPGAPGHGGRRPGAARPARHGLPRRGDLDGPDAGRERPAARDSGTPRRLRRADRAGGAHRAATGPPGTRTSPEPITAVRAADKP